MRAAGWVAVALVAAACGRSASKRAAGSDAAASAAAPAAAVTPWHFDDFQQAAKLDCAGLPRWGSTDFQRMTHPDVLAAIDDPSGSIDKRLPILIDYQVALGTIAKSYGLRCSGPAEFMTVVAAELELGAREAPLIDQFIARIPKDDPSYETRRGGIAQMYAGLGNLVLGATLDLSQQTLPNGATIAPRLGRAIAAAQRAYPPEVLASQVAGLRGAAAQETDAARAEILKLVVAQLPPR